MAAPRILVVNGTNLATLGLVIADCAPNPFSGIRQRTELANLPGRYGQLRLARRPEIQPGQATVAATLVAPSRAALESQADAIKALMAGRFTMAWADDETRQWMNVSLESPDALTIPPLLTQRAVRFTLQLLAEDPRRVAATPLTVDFTAAPQPITLGDVVSYPTITITGPVAAPAITYGALVMSFPTLSLGAGEQMVLDCWNMTITVRNGPGAEYAAEDTDWIEFDPDAGAGNLGIAPAPALASATWRPAWR